MDENPLWLRWEFWAAMLFAVAVKFRASRKLTLLPGLASTVAAIAGALVFTDPAVKWLEVSGESRYAVAALVGLTCEHIGRMLVEGRFSEALDLFRGKK